MMHLARRGIRNARGLAERSGAVAECASALVRECATVRPRLPRIPALPHSRTAGWLAGAALSTAMLLGVTGAASAQLAVRGEVVYPVSGPAIRDAVVLVRDGKIERVGPAAEVAVPEGYHVLTAKVVTPGLVDAHSVVGLAGIFNQPHDQDQLEASGAIQPELRAIDAYNPNEALVEWLRNLGVTTVHTGHGPGALVSGQTMIVKTRGTTVGEAVVDSATMLAMTIGESVSETFKSPGTRAKGMAMLRQSLLEANEYARKMEGPADERPARDLRLEALAKLLSGELTALVTAERAPDILATLRLREEFGFPLVLDGASEAYLVLDEIRAAGVPVIVHPVMVRPAGERANASLETLRQLRAAGISTALQSGFEGYVPKTRVVLFEAAMAAANGTSWDDALRSITLDAARIIGLDHRVGSLEPGKDADLALFDGDPFEHTSHVCAVVIEGEVVSEECR